MSEAQSSSKEQFVVEISRRNRINKNCHKEASTVTLSSKSSTTSEVVSRTPVSTHSTDANDYDSLALISSSLSTSTAIDSPAKSIAQQHFNTSPITVDEKNSLIKQGKFQQQQQQQPYSSAIVILNRNTAITIDRKEFAQISPYFRAAFYGGFSETKSKLLNFDRTKSEEFLHCCVVLNQLMNEKHLQTFTCKVTISIREIRVYHLKTIISIREIRVYHLKAIISIREIRI
uniref:BTB domain-containing protein n=1 Tax=Loa loa TaxID=7209 RepID=A0A1I7VDV2_LOALO